MKLRNNVSQALILFLVLITFCMLIPGQAESGSLEPGAAPASTMKTLDEVEPRIPIPGSSTAIAVYTISQSGSYYLTADRVCSGTGIQVDADNVTIDLMGYSLTGPGEGTVNGITLNGYSNVEIRNGTIRNFYRGIYAVSTTGSGHRIIDIRAVANIQTGIYLLSEGNLVKGCTASLNGNSSSGGTVYGIYTGSYSTVTNNLASENGKSGSSYVYGIYAFGSCMVINNFANNNGSSAGNDVYGIRAGAYSTITGNKSHGNGEGISADTYGIHCGSASPVINNSSTVNGARGSGTSYGIHLFGYNLADQNIANGNSINMTSPGTCTTCTYGTNNAP